ncbi:MAG: peptide chain release factor N(5)-glutamine methyltransferase [Oscillospiraceae bacterium]|nr:peptide chain release factor N(5)-glutamine methyltransferase [Oscillospiraceae bacterium]
MSGSSRIPGVSGTYHNVYLDARGRLREKYADSASLEARFMLMAAAGKTQEELLRDAALYVTAEVLRRYEDMLARRKSGEPLAYVTGAWNFCGLPLIISPDVLIPRVDTEPLAEAAIARARNIPGCRALDLCTGSGCVALAIASKAPGSQVTMADIDAAALRVAKRNARGLKLLVNAVKADVLSPPPAALGLYDIITCIPPYIPTGEIASLDAEVRDHEPLKALDGGPDGMDFYRALARHWPPALKPDGVMMLEIGAGMLKRVRGLFTDFTTAEVITDSGGVERVLIMTPRR